MRKDTDEVAHGPTDHQHRSFFSHALGRPLLQAVDRGVLAVHIVAHLGFRHRPAHLRSGPGDRVAAQVDCFHTLSLIGK